MKKLEKKHRNWRRPEDYEDMRIFSLEQWSWEFLRRNPAYIKDWETLTQGLSEAQKQEHPFALAMNTTIPSKISYGLLQAHEWGLAEPYVNPDFDHKNLRLLPVGGGVTQQVRNGEMGVEILGEPDYETGSILLEFCFYEPIAPQLKDAKNCLIRFQEESKRKGHSVRKAFKPRRNLSDPTSSAADEWILLVRILDAKAAGVKDSEIARTLGCDLKGVQNKRRQALRYITQDYRYIPYSVPPPSTHE